MRVMTRDLGEVEVAPDQVVEFVSPLLGFEGHRRFAIVPVPHARPFHWLQSLEEQGLAFPIVSAAELCVAFAGDDLDLQRLGADDWSEVDFWIIVAIRADGGSLRPNLMAPVAVCRRSRRAAQLVLAEREGPK